MTLRVQRPKIGIFSFFAGAGFLDLGFEKTEGFETLFVNEYHKPFLEIYQSSRIAMGIREPFFGYSTDDIRNFLEVNNLKRLNETVNSARVNFDLLGFIGGPPCPDFSVGGKNKGKEGENGRLSGTYIELIVKNKPDFFLFENVKGLYRTSKHRVFFDEMKAKLISNGYSLTERLINSIEYGAPQDRDRIILIGFHKDSFKKLGNLPRKTDLNEIFDWDSKRLYDRNQVFKLNWPSQDEFQRASGKKIPEGIIKELTVQYWFEKNDVLNHPNAGHYFQPRAGLSRFQKIQEGDDLKKSYKRLHRWRYSPTAAYGNNEVHLHPYEPRRLSVSEALAVQSLPKEFVISEKITLSNMFKTIGNGVPFLAAKGLAESILNFIESRLTKHHEDEKTDSK